MLFNRVKTLTNLISISQECKKPYCYQIKFYCNKIIDLIIKKIIASYLPYEDVSKLYELKSHEPLTFQIQWMVL